jgi:hypothetical protein
MNKGRDKFAAFAYSKAETRDYFCGCSGGV